MNPEIRATLALIAASGLLFACGDDGRGERETRERAERLALELTPVEVTYEVEGVASYGTPTADMTLETPTGTEQAAVALPLINDAGTPGLIMEFKRGAFVYISAQASEYGKQITCRITVDGEVISENTSTAQFGIATCKGSAG